VVTGALPDGFPLGVGPRRSRRYDAFRGKAMKQTGLPVTMEARDKTVLFTRELGEVTLPDGA